MENRGFTLIELLVVLSIISLLSSVVLSALNTARSKGRYASIIQQMKQIQIAALAYRTEVGAHAPDTMPDGKPAFVPEHLVAWPKPPCGPAWNYDWDNWSASTGFVGVHLYRTGVGAQYKYCIDIDTNCAGSSAPDIRTVKQISC